MGIVPLEQTDVRNCGRCKGQGEYDFLGRMKHCAYCDGDGVVPVADTIAIEKAVYGRRGFRAGPCKTWDRSTYEGARNYYVWRMARFHGGADITMPVMAGLFIEKDPEIKALDMLADAIAVKAFGSNLRAAKAWQNVIGG